MANLKPSFIFIVISRLRRKNFLYEFYFRDKHTLDIGCGEGEFLKCNKDIIEGIDANTRVISKLSDQGFLVSRASVDSLPFADGYFEAAHCRNVIEHLEIDSALGLISEATRVLNPGGILVLASEVADKKFWNTFGHVKPYPPEAIIKLLRADSRERFDGLGGLEYAGLFYLGEYFSNKILYFLSALIAYFTPWFRREYFLVLRKK